jgi:hypothetical protein
MGICARMIPPVDRERVDCRSRRPRPEDPSHLGIGSGKGRRYAPKAKGERGVATLFEEARKWS